MSERLIGRIFKHHLANDVFGFKLATVKTTITIMKNKSLLFFLIAGNMMFAQRNFNMTEATMGLGGQFATERILQPSWKNDNTLSFVTKNRDSLLIKSQANKWESQTALTVKQLEEIINTSAKGSTFKLRIIPTNLTWLNDNEVEFYVNESTNKLKYYFKVNLADKKVVNSFKFDAQGAQQIISRNGDHIAWLKDNNIVISTNKGGDVQITNDPALDIINGSSDTHRNEFGINKGMWWSPKQDQLLYYRKDQSMVTSYPIIQWSERVAEVKNIKYPMAGMANEQVSLVVYDVYTGKKVTLQTGEVDQFLTMVTWDPSGNYVYVGVLNREQNHLKVNQYNVATGAFEKTLFEESSKTYTEPNNSLVFVPGTTDQFLYFTEADGYRQLSLYDTNGKLIKKLGHENVIVTDFLGFDDDAKNLYYIGVTNQGLDRQLFKTNLKKGKTEQITTLSGTHSVVLNKNKTLFLDQFNNLETPNKVSIVNAESKKEKEILVSKNPYEGVITMPETKITTITAADGKTPLNARIIYPTNFDATKKYPVMVYVYGGPHAQLVTNTWLGGANLFFNYMAQNGYIVFTVDSRGSFNRGRAFEQVIHRQLGQAEMADQMKGVDYLKSLPYVNQDKIGVYGWSFGGFMTTTLSVTHPEVFKVGVAGGPVMDWKMYEIMYGERYMDMPSENPTGYEKTSLLNKADKINNKLLIIHGAQDPVVVQQHSMEFIEAAIKAKKQVDYFLYPSHEHNVQGIDRVHLNDKIAQYFFDYLEKPTTK